MALGAFDINQKRCMMLLRTIALLCFCFFATTTYAYEPDFELDGSFLVEAHDLEEKRDRIQLWHIKLLKGLVDKKDAFTDFSLVVMDLVSNEEKNTYALKDVEIYSYSPDSRFNSLLITNNSFNFEFGALKKLNVRISFNQDGTLANITGSILHKTNPANVTTFKLLKDSRQVCIIQDNSFQTKDYLYNIRR